jgi:hypothetical protein
MKTWTQKNGEKVIISSMTDNHLKNAQVMLARKGLVNKDLNKELKKRKLVPAEPALSKALYDLLRPEMGGDMDIMFGDLS